MADDDRLVIRIGGWPPVYAWTLADARRIRREIVNGYLGDDRAVALAALDRIIDDLGAGDGAVGGAVVDELP